MHLCNGGDAERRYALAALESEACYVEAARPGDRNNALNRAAFCAGTLIPSGGISVSEVEEVLTVAALKAGLHPSEIATTLRSGLSAGMNQPRRIGAPWVDAVDAAELLDTIEELITRFVFCDSDARTATALWIACTWFEEAAQVAPRSGQGDSVAHK